MRIRSQKFLPYLTTLALSALLTGCANMTTTASPSQVTGLALTGNVHGGQQPVVGAHVYLLAAGTGGYGSASTSLLLPSSTGQGDSIGGYVLTDSTGAFSITGDYTCTAGTQVYLYALGGNPGAGANTAAGFLAAVGQCPSSTTFANTVPFIYMNEVSTVAFAYALAGFASDATDVASSNSTLAQTNIANAFLTVNNLVPVSTGAALTSTPVGNGVVPQALINTLANILANCVNSTGASSTQCSTLLNTAKSLGTTGNAATDTATAAIYIAKNPAANVATLYANSTPAAAFAPALTSAPNDFIVGINYSNAGSTGAGLSGAYSIAIDAHGSVWVTNSSNNTVSKLSATGIPLSPQAGFTTAGAIPTGIAIDNNEDAWAIDTTNGKLVEFNTAGAVISPAGGYSGGGSGVQAIAIDGSNNEWIVNITNNTLSKFNGGTAAIGNPFTGGGLSKPTSVAIDNVGNVWVANQTNASNSGAISEFTTAGVAITAVTGYTGNGLNNPQAIAIDASNNVFVANYGNSVSKFTSTGAAAGNFTGGGLNRPQGISVDGSGNVWVANAGGPGVTEFSSTGSQLSPSTGFQGPSLNGPNAIAVDGLGNIWITNFNSTTLPLTEFIGAATPVVTPLAAASGAGTLGTRP